MAETYEPTSDPNVVEKSTVEEVDMSQLVGEYQTLKTEYQAIPDWEKTVPDQETLDFWNSEQENLHVGTIADLKSRAQVLKSKIDPIRNQGLFPAQYEDEYQQLVNFINS